MNLRTDNKHYGSNMVELPLCFDSFPHNNNNNYHILHNNNECKVGYTPVNDDIGISSCTFIYNILLEFCRNPCLCCL